MEDLRVVAHYLIETSYDLNKAAQIIAGEQSTGTFVPIPGETEEVKRRYGAQIIKIEQLETVQEPSLPYSKVLSGEKIKRAKVSLSFPLHNFGLSIPNLMSTIAGNLYELREFSGIKLMDVELPSEFIKKYKGPRFGISGTRELTGVYNRPLIGTIVKPSTGLSIEEYRPLIRDLAEAGIDFIKDDELCADPPYAPFEERVKVVMDEINRAAEKTGKKVMYAFNITDETDEMKRKHDLVLAAGGTCVMVSINSVGWAGLIDLSNYTELPIHGHRNQWGAISRSPVLGMDFKIYQKICRLAGVDHLHTNGLNSKFADDNEIVVESIKDCLTPMFGDYRVLPVLSSGQWAASAIPTYQAVNSIDVLHLAGGGILAHPEGTLAGVNSMKQGWNAAINNIPLEIQKEKYPELKRAIETFGK